MPSVPSTTRQLAGDPFVALVAAGALAGAAIQVRESRFDGVAVGLVVVAALLAAWAIGRVGRADDLRPARAASGARLAVVGGLVVAQVVALGLLTPEALDDSSALLVATALGGAAVGLAAAADLLRPDPRAPRASAAVLVAGVGVFGLCWLISEGTSIDVVHYQEVAAERLLAGNSPWVRSQPNPFDAAESAAFFGPGLVAGDRLLFGFPYPPLSLLGGTVGHVLGDVRYAHLLAVLTAGGALLAGFGDRWSGRAGAVLLLTSPMLLPTVQRGWTETFLLVALAVALVALRRSRHDPVAVVAIGLFVAVKQYAVLFLPVLVAVSGRWRGWRRQVRAGVGAVATAVVVSAPLVLPALHDFLFSVVEVHLRQPFRPDGMTLPALVDRLGGPGEALARPMTIVFVVLALGWTLARAPRDVRGAGAGVGLVMLAFLLGNQQGFTNYYMFAVGALWMGLAAWDTAGERGGRDTADAGAP